MPDEPVKGRNAARILRLLLRIVGTTSLFAVVAVMMPYTWMNAIHGWLGMGPLPDEPVVGYLARSTSACYAISGGLLWLVSFDLRRYLAVLRYFGVATVLFGLMVLVVDWREGMPWFWCLMEGPFDTAFGAAILWLSAQVGKQ